MKARHALARLIRRSVVFGRASSLCAQGTSASARRRSKFISSAIVATALLAVPAAALAAAPETPETTAPGFFSATEASLAGFLDPGQSGPVEALTYEFLYKESASECAGGGATAEEASNEEGHQEVGAFLSGLSPDTTYTFCLLARNGGAETSLSAPRSFKTRILPEAPTLSTPSPLLATSATLRGVLNPNAPGEPGTYLFRYKRSSTECEGGAGDQQTPVEPALGNQAEAVSAEIGGLLPGAKYTVCLVFFNEGFNGAISEPLTFSTQTAAPTVSDAVISEISDSAATVRAQISPGGLLTGFHLEYVSSADFATSGWSSAKAQPVPDASLAPSSEPASVVEHLNGLAPGTEYHVRFVASNTGGNVIGAETTLKTTAIGPAATLPDGRVPELVTNLGAFGEPDAPWAPERGVFSPQTSSLIFQASSDGSSLAYVGQPPETGGNGTTGLGAGQQFIAHRGEHEWSDEAVAEPEISASGLQGVSPDLTRGYIASEIPLTPGALAPPCRVLYSRENSTQTFRPLVTETQNPEGHCGNPGFAGESQDGSEVIFASQTALTPGAQESTETVPPHNGLFSQRDGYMGSPCDFGCNLYLSSEGKLKLVSELPNGGGEIHSANFGGYAAEPPLASGPGNRPEFSNAISNDGSRIFWTSTEPGPTFQHVYVLENGSTEVPVSGGGDPAQYWTASPDGHFAFYTEDGRLWRFDTALNEAEPLTPAGAEVKGVIGTNDTGTAGNLLYFVAEGVLASNTADHGGGVESAQGGQPNLYVERNGVITFIANLSPSDNNMWYGNLGVQTETAGDWIANSAMRTAQVSSDGSHLVFQSVRRLTGYDNTAVAGTNNGSQVSEVYRFSADDGTVVCASCDPSGLPPAIFQVQPNQTDLAINGSSIIQRHLMSENGNRVFFNSFQRLTPQDRNGRQDVYEWEAEGEGSCPVRNSPAPNRGCIFLLTEGNTAEQSWFIDAEADGKNIFVEHRGPLGGVGGPAGIAQIYDLRVSGGFRHSETQCGETACGPGSGAGALAGPSTSSELAETHGNVKPKKHRKHHKRHKQKGQKPHHRHAHGSRRAAK